MIGGGTLRLADGRALAWAEWGDPLGMPVLHCHGAPGSRFQRYPDDRMTAELGVRFITADRPGYGASSRAPGRTVLDWARDMENLADRLGLDSFAVHAMSGGGPFALACAAIGGRVEQAAIVAGLGPLDRPGAFDGMDPGNVQELAMAQEQPEKLEAFLANLNPSSGLPSEEVDAFGLVDGLVEMFMQDSPEMSRQGTAGWADDDLACVGSWGFALEEIAVPVVLWHGGRDRLVPAHHSEFMASHIPSATVRLCPDDTHLSMFAHQREVLGAIVERSAR